MLAGAAGGFTSSADLEAFTGPVELGALPGHLTLESTHARKSDNRKRQLLRTLKAGISWLRAISCSVFQWI